MERKFESKTKLAVAVAIIAVMGIGGAFAYFTDTDQAVNSFTVGKVQIELQEPSWNADNPPKNITPNQVIEKDPQIKNTGKNNAFMFVEVQVPYGNISTADAEGHIGSKADTELFTYTLNRGWVEVGTPVKNSDSNTFTHVYAYSENNKMTEVLPNTVTGTVFDEVKFVNAVNDEGLEETTQNINVTAYGIQVTDIGDGTTNKTSPADVWAVIKNQFA